MVERSGAGSSLEAEGMGEDPKAESGPVKRTSSRAREAAHWLHGLCHSRGGALQAIAPTFERQQCPQCRPRIRILQFCFRRMQWLVREVLAPKVPIKSPVVHSLQNTVGINFFGRFQVRQRPRNLQDTVMGARAEIHLAHGMFHHAAALRIQLTVLFDQPGRHGAVGVQTRDSAEALGLDRA